MGLVHARLATALLVAGYPDPTPLRHRSFLMLGSHAGLEVQILRDLGAATVTGIEKRADIVQAGILAQLVTADDLLITDYWVFLENRRDRWDTIIALAPENLSLERLAGYAGPRLTSAGHLIVIAAPQDITEVTEEWLTGPAMEGTMQWYRYPAD